MMRLLSDSDAMFLVWNLLDRREWRPDDLETIAHIVGLTGRVIREPVEVTDAGEAG